uniref:LOB domain-containing protein n=1 Tax=Kalanchoe fedtschenkoi TaxID=63787 RepID=A0A7N0V4T1_KALFE
MADPPGGRGRETMSHRKGQSKRPDDEATGRIPAATPTTPPCGACKFLRRKCAAGCVFAPYFGSDQGAARFAAVHKVFGASNVSKLLQHIPVNRRQDTVVTVTYEAQARLSDPVYGCVSTILALQQQVAALQTELSMVQSQLINRKLAATNSLQTSQQQQLLGPQQQMSSMSSVMMQPAYSNNSSSSNNNNDNNTLMNHLASFNSNFGAATCFQPLRLSRHQLQNEDDDEEKSPDAIIFTNDIFHRRH